MSDLPRDTRWSDDPELPSELSELLRAGRAELGNRDEVAALAERLSALLGPAAGLGGDRSPGGARVAGAAEERRQHPAAGEDQ